MINSIPVILADYDTEWPHRAQQLIGQLNATAPKTFLYTHHIGSTAVPGLIAKPIIDLLPVVNKLADADVARAALESIGYEWHGEFGIAGRRYCRLNDVSGNRISHVHIFEASSPHITRHIAFRDYLRANPHIAATYAEEKRRARTLHPYSSHAYSDAKSAWITRTQAEAMDWVHQI